MHLWLRCLLPLTVFIHTRVAFAVYRDEAYQIDFHHALFGIPQAHTTFFHRPSNSSKASLLYTLSESGIVGSINPKDGAVLWRQSLSTGGKNFARQALLKAGDGSNTIVSALEGNVQVWDAVDGHLDWSWRTSGDVKAVEVAETEIFVAVQIEGSHSIVKCFSTLSGEEKWEHKDSSGDAPHSLSLTKNRLFYVSLQSARLKGLKIKSTELDPATGKSKGQPRTISSEGELSSEDSILFSGLIGGLPVVLWMDKALKTVKVASLSTSQKTVLGALSVAGDSADRIMLHAAPSPESEPHFLLHLQAAERHWAKIYHIDTSSEAVKLAYDLPSLPGKGNFAASTQGPQLYFVRYTSSSVSLFSSTASRELQAWHVPSKPQDSSTELRTISHAAAEVASRGSTKYSVRSVLSLESGDWELIRNGESVWVKKEGLTGVIAATFAEIPRNENLAQKLAVDGQYNFMFAYVHRLKRHLKELQYLPAWAEEKYHALRALALGDDVSSSALQLRRDKFGFHKILIVATKKGRLAALDTGNGGRAIWTVRPVSLEAGSTWDVISLDAEDGTVLLRAAKGEFLRVESSTGKTIDYQQPGIIKDLHTTVPISDLRGRSALVPVNADGSLNEVPSVDFGEDLVLVTKGVDNILHGWSLSYKKRPSIAWTFQPISGNRIDQVLHLPQHNPVASIGRALGDRNVLYKYLNPNLVLVTAVNDEQSSATFHLLDATSGAILHSVTHPNVDATKPISSTLSENFFTYSLYSQAASQDSLQIEKKDVHGYQLVVSEIFESPFPNERGPLGSASNYSTRQPLAMEDNEAIPMPHVISQTYLLPDPISYLAMTSTLQGITPRSLLCITSTLKSLISIPGNVLDPRRPVGRDPTSAEIEEGLFRYNAVLDFDPRWTLNHKREFLGLSKVIASPTLLESTSLVFAFGEFDLFGTKVSPIGGFDLLGKGFSKFQLVATVAALAVGTSFLAPLVRKKQIDGQWKT